MVGLECVKNKQPDLTTFHQPCVDAIKTKGCDPPIYCGIRRDELMLPPKSPSEPLFWLFLSDVAVSGQFYLFQIRLRTGSQAVSVVAISE